MHRTVREKELIGLTDRRVHPARKMAEATTGPHNFEKLFFAAGVFV